MERRERGRDLQSGESKSFLENKEEEKVKKVAPADSLGGPNPIREPMMTPVWRAEDEASVGSNQAGGGAVRGADSGLGLADPAASLEVRVRVRVGVRIRLRVWVGVRVRVRM